VGCAGALRAWPTRHRWSTVVAGGAASMVHRCCLPGARGSAACRILDRSFAFWFDCVRICVIPLGQLGLRGARSCALASRPREPEGIRRRTQPADSGGRDGRRPSHGPCQTQESPALRGGGRRRRHRRRPRRGRHGDRRERGTAHRQSGNRLDVDLGKRDADQAPGRDLPGEHLLRPLLRDLSVRGQHRREHVPRHAGHPDGERALRHDHPRAARSARCSPPTRTSTTPSG